MTDVNDGYTLCESLHQGLTCSPPSAGRWRYGFGPWGRSAWGWWTVQGGRVLPLQTGKKY